MHTVTADKAETNFGDTLVKAQRSPVKITKSGKPVAVLMSMENYCMTEDLKRQVILERFACAEAEIAAGELIDGEEFMKDLIAGKFD